MNYAEAKSYLDTFINYEYVSKKHFPRIFNLKRTRDLLSYLNSPQDNLNIIHIAGSKGKGSTAMMTAHILKQAGYRTGLYTSPHIYNYRERIRFMDMEYKSSGEGLFKDEISVTDFTECLIKIREGVEDIGRCKDIGNFSFYEVVTVLALYYFRKVNADFVVLETGLGGRLDATNVVSSMIGVITCIDLEHTHILGDSLDKIAMEKVAILKEDTRYAVISPQEESVRNIIWNYGKNMGVECIDVKSMFSYNIVSQTDYGQTVRVDFDERMIEIFIPVLGEHQVLNVLNALGCVYFLKKEGYPIRYEDIIEGIKYMMCPIRFEIVCKDPIIILDSAHTIISAQCLFDTVEKVFGHRRVSLVLGFSEDKNVEEIGKVLGCFDCDVIFTKANHPKSMDMEDISFKEFMGRSDHTTTTTVKKALELALFKGNMIVVTGSVFVAAEAREILLKDKISI